MKHVALLMTLSFLTACGDSYSPYGGTDEPTGVKIGKPYTVRGTTYHPSFEADYDETGIASWYGPGFHNRMTASGERYDQHEYTAAHRTLPMPSMVRVTNLDNGRSVMVRVNDRGPFEKGRIIDLSFAAAQSLGVIGTGTAQVRVEYLPNETIAYMSQLGLEIPEQWAAAQTSRPEETAITSVAVSELELAGGPATDTGYAATAASPPAASFQFISSAQASEAPFPPVMQSRYLVMAGSFAGAENAQRHAAALRGVANTNIKESVVQGRRMYRVVLGPVSDVDSARRMIEQLNAQGIPDARILVE